MQFIFIADERQAKRHEMPNYSIHSNRTLIRLNKVINHIMHIFILIATVSLSTKDSPSTWTHSIHALMEMFLLLHEQTTDQEQLPSEVIVRWIEETGHLPTFLVKVKVHLIETYLYSEKNSHQMLNP